MQLSDLVVDLNKVGVPGIRMVSLKPSSVEETGSSTVRKFDRSQKETHAYYALILDSQALSGSNNRMKMSVRHITQTWKRNRVADLSTVLLEDVWACVLERPALR